MEQWVDIISSFGFPIACCVILMWYVYHLQKTHDEEIKHIMKEHKDETSKITEAINSNTLILTKLLDKLGA